MKSARRIVIVGGVAGGASAAARARRVDESAEIHMFERGPYISFANCGLPYHIAGEIQNRSKLLIMTPEKMWVRSRVQVHVNHEVLSIDRCEQDDPGSSRRWYGRRFSLRQAHPEPGRKAHRAPDSRRRIAKRLYPPRRSRHGSHHQPSSTRASRGQPPSLVADLSASRWPKRFIAAACSLALLRSSPKSSRCSTTIWPCILKTGSRQRFCHHDRHGSKVLQRDRRGTGRWQHSSPRN